MQQYLRVAALLCAMASAGESAAEDCKTITDRDARLACFDGAPQPSTPADLGFPVLKRAMNTKYASYFAHHQTSLIGTKTLPGGKVFFIRVPDPNPTLQITASCLGLDAGGWMCTLRPNYGTFGPLPLQIK